MILTRVGVVCDFVEDNWHSMELVARMLLDNLKRDFSSVIEATRIGPPMTLRLSQLPWSGGTSTARNADQFLNRFWDYPRFLLKNQKTFDLFHVVDHTYGQLVHELPAERTVVTCHDLDAFRCILEPQRDPRSKIFRAMSRRILSGFCKAARVACDTSAIRQEILTYGLLPPERVTVIPLGVHPSCTTMADSAADEEASRLLGPGDENRPGSATEILHVGSTAPRKRIEILLQVFAKVRAEIPNARLIRVGGPFNEAHSGLIEQLGLREAILVLPFLERSTLAAVYRRASVVVQPSAGEGFGLPVVEAMACGTPVIASDLPVLREVGGSAAYYCPVDDVPAWSTQVLELLCKRQSRAEWQQIRAASLEQAKKFSWSAYTAKTAELYRELMCA